MLYLDRSSMVGTWGDPTKYVDTSKKLVFSIEATSDASGNASIKMKELYGSVSGYCVECNPDDTTPPTTAYTIQLNDDQGFDILHGQGAGLSTTSTAFIYVDKTPLAGDVTISLSSMGASTKVVVKLFIDRDDDF